MFNLADRLDRPKQELLERKSSQPLIGHLLHVLFSDWLKIKAKFWRIEAPSSGRKQDNKNWNNFSIKIFLLNFCKLTF